MLSIVEYGMLLLRVEKKVIKYIKFIKFISQIIIFINDILLIVLDHVSCLTLIKSFRCIENIIIFNLCLST